MFQWPSGYGISVRHMRFLFHNQLKAIYYLMDSFVTGNSQRTLYIC